jgi:hypothetical protein
VEFVLVFSHLVRSRDVEGHGRAADVVQAARAPPSRCGPLGGVAVYHGPVVLSILLQDQAEPGPDVFLGEQPDLVVLVCISMLVVSFLCQTMVAWGDYWLSCSV